jgi:hypothetical protein
MATVYREVWTGEVVKGFNAGLKDTFLDGVKSYDQHVKGDDEAQVIHATYFGVEPDVLINNTTYPIPVQELNGADIPIALDKYQTTATPITDDELFALSYDKIKNTKDSHVESIVKNRLKKAIHAFGPNTNADHHPVLLTTGDTIEGRKRLRWADIIRIRSAYAKMGVAIEGLRLVLCPDHVNDLLLEETSLFAKSYVNFNAGVISNQLGFEFREFFGNPYYNVSTKTKLSFGAVVDDTTDSQASIVFPVSKTGKATGVTKMYWSKAEGDPLTQRNLINFRNFFIALPLVETGFVAMVSGKA